ncbi:antibiotic acetyltransferase [Salinadaptatus halalkaliphilus]|uniref:Antibiotic acetyltransferase n=1 Tax=Salinadaptatus halalkaliphilus TaxID=2419781 RepID=A0A4S3TLR0_9EURY|nr:CatB-related O-acetyltransferase [Salinadaptatus halalkaliphilus]THE63935.1 antibiotic acetyltransferase [Salinadaptatus halalkaliphilus]
MTLATVVNRSLSLLGYPAVARELLSRYSDSTTLEVASSARIAKGCLLRGRVSLAPRTRVSRGCLLNGTVAVGRRTNLEPHCELVGDVTIGNYCAIARETTFQEPNHEMDRASMQIRFYDEVLDSDLAPTSEGPITVGNDVWVGTRATILSGVSIGDGAVIGAGAVVTDDVDPYAVVAGVPAERVGWRFSEPIREKLLDLEWWHWDESTLRNRRAFFERTLEDPDDVPTVAEFHGDSTATPTASSTETPFG